MAFNYDDTNIFARILRKEIPSKTVLETDHCLAFEDIAPQAPVHVLVIPKGRYVSFDHFAEEASESEVVDLIRTVGRVARMTGVDADEGAGHRIIANAGQNGVQEVPHLHIHVVGGRRLGRMLPTLE